MKPNEFQNQPTKYFWGTFSVWDSRRGYVQHVAPCDSEGYVVDGHTVSADCYCAPEEDRMHPGLWVHYMCN